MAARLRIFLQVLLTVLALGLGMPQPICAAGASQADMTCCCTQSPVCHCHPDEPCQQSCTLTQIHLFDKQVPARTALAFSPPSLLFSIAPTKLKYPVFIPVAHQRDVTSSGSPPQAKLCLWLI